MTDCREFEPRIDRAHAGELDENERELLLAHLETCTDCSDLFDLLGRVRAEGEVPEPAADRFAAMRRAVVAELARPAVVPFPAPTPAPSGWRLSPALAAGLAFLLLAAGWLLGSRGVPRAAERSAFVADPSAAGPAAGPGLWRSIVDSPARSAPPRPATPASKTSRTRRSSTRTSPSRSSPRAPAAELRRRAPPRSRAPEERSARHRGAGAVARRQLRSAPASAPSGSPATARWRWS
ncbi:MAG: zf-HC2 domain-containing protein [Thermoanaerobaculia bacterium]